MAVATYPPIFNIDHPTKFRLCLSSHTYPPKLKFPVFLDCFPYSWHLYTDTGGCVICGLFVFVHFYEYYYRRNLFFCSVISTKGLLQTIVSFCTVYTSQEFLEGITLLLVRHNNSVTLPNTLKTDIV